MFFVSFSLIFALSLRDTDDQTILSGHSPSTNQKGKTEWNKKKDGNFTTPHFFSFFFFFFLTDP